MKSGLYFIVKSSIKAPSNGATVLGVNSKILTDFFVLYYNSQENLLFNYLVKVDTDFMLLDFCNHLTNFLNGIFALDFFTSCANSTFFNFTQYFASEFKTFLVVREKYTLAVLYSLPFVKKSYGLCATNFTIKLGL
jgi:hypothetical protein